MGRPKKDQQKLVDKPITGLEAEIRKIVSEVLQEEQQRLTKEDIQEIVIALLPDLDEMVAKTVKKHTKILIGWIDSNLKE